MLDTTQDNLIGKGGKIEANTGIMIDAIMKNKDKIGDGLKKVGVFLLDTVQFALDILGLIPAVGEICDAANGIIYTLRGDWISAGLSFVGCIPFAGWAATQMK